METNYTVDYFIKKFEAIPEDKWCEGAWSNSKGANCANGHCGIEANGLLKTNQSINLKKVFSPIVIHGETGILLTDSSNYDFSFKALYINDNSTKEYQQPTPKQRILAALYDIKKMQEPKHIDITKELAVFPIQETSDVIATKETILS